MIMRIHTHSSPPNLLEHEAYDPNKFIDGLLRRLNLRNDASLSRFLQYHPAVISKMRHRVTGVSSENLIRIHELTGIPVKELRTMMGVPAVYFPIQTQGEK